MQSVSAPLISIIIPVYNVEPYLRECLDSVVNQTLKAIEIICVDDGSTDNSPAILDEYAKNDSRINIIHQSNAGPSAARNAGLANAQGKYIYFCDSDDTIDLDLCRMTFIAAEYHQCDMLCFDAVIYPSKCRLDDAKDMPNFGYPAYPAVGNSALLFMWTCLKLFRHDFIQSHRLKFAENLRRGEDLFFQWQVYLTSAKVAVLPANLYFYRNRPGSLMKIKDVQQIYVFDLYYQVRCELDRIGVYEQHKDMHIRQKVYDFYHSGYVQADPHVRSKIRKTICDSLTSDDWSYIETNPRVGGAMKSFYRFCRGDDRVAWWKFQLWWIFVKTAKDILSFFGAGIWKFRISHLFAKRFSRKYARLNRALCNESVALQEEILKLRAK